MICPPTEAYTKGIPQRLVCCPWGCENYAIISWSHNNAVPIICYHCDKSDWVFCGESREPTQPEIENTKNRGKEIFQKYINKNYILTADRIFELITEKGIPQDVITELMKENDIIMDCEERLTNYLEEHKRCSGFGNRNSCVFVP